MRFKENGIVRRLVDRGGSWDWNQIAIMAQRENVPVEDVEQFWQLLGYSVSGYGDLSFIRPETVNAADDEAQRVVEDAESTVPVVDCAACGESTPESDAVMVDWLEVDPRAPTDDGGCLVCPKCAAEKNLKDAGGDG